MKFENFNTNKSQSGWRQETAKNPFSRQETAMQHPFPGLELQVIPSAIEQLQASSTLHSFCWPQNEPLNHHHQQTPQSQFSLPSFHAQHNLTMQGRQNQHGVWLGPGSENNASRHHQERIHGRNYQEQGGNSGWAQGRQDRAWRQDLPEFRDQSSWNGGRRWSNH